MHHTRQASKTMAVRSASGFYIKVNVSGKTSVSLTLQKSQDSW